MLNGTPGLERGGRRRGTQTETPCPSNLAWTTEEKETVSSSITAAEGGGGGNQEDCSHGVEEGGGGGTTLCQQWRREFPSLSLGISYSPPLLFTWEDVDDRRRNDATEEETSSSKRKRQLAAKEANFCCSCCSCWCWQCEKPHERWEKEGQKENLANLGVASKKKIVRTNKSIADKEKSGEPEFFWQFFHFLFEIEIFDWLRGKKFYKKI